MAKKSEIQKLSPIEKRRRELRSGMSSPLGEMADLALERRKQVSSIGVLYAYDTGAQVEEICTNEKEYGAGDIKKFAEYLGETEQTLYMMRRVANAFKRDFVKMQSSQPMSNGRLSSQAHWFLFARIEGDDKRIAAINKVWKLGVSAPELENELFGPDKLAIGGARRGAKVKVPTSVVAAINRGAKLCSKLTNYWTGFNSEVLGSIEELPPDTVNAELVSKLDSAKQVVADVSAFLIRTEEAIDVGLGRLRHVLEVREETDDEVAAALENAGDKPAKKGTKKPKAAKASKNGKVAKAPAVKVPKTKTASKKAKVKKAAKAKTKKSKRVPAAAT